eukprot:TRINITY_DN40_c0_g1_i1.p2 TRINITY_DN40_c0_g1~~TRINITY_DN40_c0_g1_i1.p2  ORF type:complete len:347 (+),score=50.24 TRINITY_DN40_c0_g1_i1:52-1092(+)
MDIPIVDLEPFLSAPESAAAREQCEAVRHALSEYGILIVRDPRAQESENSAFLDLLEKYFEQAAEAKRADERPELHFQVGVTPEQTEVPRDHSLRIQTYPEDQRPHKPLGPDAKWRFFWRMGSPPATTRYPQLNADPVIPAAFKDPWPTTMDQWGRRLLDAVDVVCQMAAISFGLPQDTFTSLMQNGPHLLAPTGSDLSKYHNKGDIFAGFHYDLNFVTAHGKSRYPGLFIWTRDGRKMPVKMPPGCLLLQAGKQFEWLTGGQVLAGFHEVVVTDATLAALQEAKAAGRSQWRISSTLFAHIASDNLLQPLAPFKSPQADADYPPTYAGDQVQAELEAINLAQTAA